MFVMEQCGKYCKCSIQLWSNCQLLLKKLDLEIVLELLIVIENFGFRNSFRKKVSMCFCALTVTHISTTPKKSVEEKKVIMCFCALMVTHSSQPLQRKVLMIRFKSCLIA